MKKNILYQYMGTNGVLSTPIHLEGIYYIRKLALQADNGYQLTKDDKNFTSYVIIPEDELEEWREVKID